MFVSRLLGTALWLLTLGSGCSPPPPRHSARSSNTALTRSELHALSRADDRVGLRVVYPALTDVVRVRDSSFLFGSVAQGDTRLTINGYPVRVWPNGAWLAWIPFPPE